MGWISNARIQCYDAGVVPVFAPDDCPELEQEGDHGLVYLTVDGRDGPVRLPGLLRDDAEDYCESVGHDNEVGQSLRDLYEEETFRRQFGCDGEDRENDYTCGHCGHEWRAHNVTPNASGRRAPCPRCREMTRPTSND